MSQVRSRLLGFAAVVSATSLALAACGSSSNSGGSTGANPSGGPQLVSSDALTVCTHLSYKPFEFKDASGNVVGFDMDLAQNAAKQLGQSKVTIVDIDFASQTSGAVFAAKKCDMAMGAVTINDKRKQSVAFSTPYFSATQALLAKKSAGITDLSSLKGKKLGVQTDTTGQAYGDKNKDANGYETVVFDDLPTEIAGVQSGRVDAAINDNGPLLEPGLRGGQGVRHRRAVRLPLPEGRRQRLQDQGRLQRGPEEVHRGRLLQGQLQEVVRFRARRDADRSVRSLS